MDQLAIAAGRAAVRWGHADAEVIAATDLETSAPGTSPRIVLAPAGQLSADAARLVLALVGAGTPILVLTDADPAEDAGVWLSGSSVPVVVAEPGGSLRGWNVPGEAVTDRGDGSSLPTGVQPSPEGEERAVDPPADDDGDDDEEPGNEFTFALDHLLLMGALALSEADSGSPGGRPAHPWLHPTWRAIPLEDMAASPQVNLALVDLLQRLGYTAQPGFAGMVVGEWGVAGLAGVALWFTSLTPGRVWVGAPLIACPPPDIHYDGIRRRSLDWLYAKVEHLLAFGGGPEAVAEPAVASALLIAPVGAEAVQSRFSCLTALAITDTGPAGEVVGARGGERAVLARRPPHEPMDVAAVGYELDMGAATLSEDLDACIERVVAAAVITAHNDELVDQVGGIRIFQ